MACPLSVRTSILFERMVNVNVPLKQTAAATEFELAMADASMYQYQHQLYDYLQVSQRCLGQ